MIIKRMKAVFGVLSGAELSLGEGLNIVYAPNESGKSTWCAFIRSMLYGIDTAERERAGFKPDKTLYAPWSGAQMSGAMDIVRGGQEISIRRAGKQNTPFREFEAAYAGTGEPVPGLEPGNAGEELTGVSKQVFERSAFIRQAGMGVAGDPELSRRIAAIVSTGEEDISFSEVDERLRVWMRARRHNKFGAIPDIESKMERLSAKAEEQRGEGERRSALEDRLKAARLKRDELRAQMEESRKQTRQSALERMAKGQEAMKSRQEDLDAARDELMARISELSHGMFGEANPEELLGGVDADYARASELGASAARRPVPVLPVLLAVLCLASAIAGVAVNYWIFAAAGVFLAGAVWSIAAYTKKRKRSESSQEELDGILARYGAASPEGILDALAIHEKLYAEFLKAKSRKDSAEAELAAAQARQKELDRKLLSDLDFAGGGTEAARIGRQFAEAEEGLRELRERAAEATGRLEALGDPLVLGSELSDLRETHRELSCQYDALRLAVETLSEANTEIQSRFSPRLGRRATELFSRLTGGRYDELRLDKELDAQTRIAGDTAGHEAAFLSAGARDQLYLALRLAICELALPEEDPCPIILDDALSAFDDERMKSALNLLKELASERQIILFTCHRREAEYFHDVQDVLVTSV